MLSANDLFLPITDVKVPDFFYDIQESSANKFQQQATSFLHGQGIDPMNSVSHITTDKTNWETGTIKPEYSKEVLAWCNKTFNLKFVNAYIVKTGPYKNGPWHCEGPIFKTRRCALNFLVKGDLGTTKAQWGVHKHIETHPEEIEKHFSGAVPVDDVDVIAEYVSTDKQPFFYNTACLHRSCNESTDVPRTLLSVSIFESTGLKEIYAMYKKGTLLRT